MQRCFELAKQGESYVAPNPMVGAVLVFNDTIIGEGYHERYGKPHAEVNCLNSVKEQDKHLISSSTLYVSLEPCAHFGKTPPCVDLIIIHKIPKVVIAVRDNFDLVNGKGIEKLRENNIEVITGILEEEGKELIKHFLYFHQYKKPYITLKFAQTKDGFIGIQHQEIKISNDLSKQYVHQLRAQHSSVLVGKKTVLADNPELTIRHWNGKNPTRIILGTKNDFPQDYNIFNTEAETLFISSDNTHRLTVDEILKQLFNKNIISVLVEGGAEVINQFIESNLWNEAHLITSDRNLIQSQILGTTFNIQHYIKAPKIHGDLTSTIYLDNDTIQILKNPNALSIA